MCPLFFFLQKHTTVWSVLAGKWDAAALRAFFQFITVFPIPPLFFFFFLPAGRERICTVFILFQFCFEICKFL